MVDKFYNPELKNSSLAIVLICSAFILMSTIVLDYGFNTIKNSSIKNNSAIVGSIINKHPELKEEIIPLVTKGITEKDKEIGIKTLSRYGYNENLNIEFLPELKNDLTKTKIYIWIISLFMFIVLFYLNYIQYNSIYKDISKITLGSKYMLENNYDKHLYTNREGEFSKLFNTFSNMRDIIRNNILDLKKEKTFLVNLLSDISHQLKTPLSSLIVFNEIIMSKDINEKEKNIFLLKSKNQLERMEWLIKSLLKLAKLDSGAIIFKKENNCLNDTIKESIETLSTKSLKNNVEIIFNGRNKIKMNHDKEWLTEAFINLIKNGIEHTDKGGYINISIVDSPIYYKVIIEDNGEGIYEEDLPNIFKRFYKGKRSKKSDSVGIGLALSKSIIEGQGGFIEVESERGYGTKFSILFLKYLKS
ncbi:HAMP domain-containing sensor histidine kinase [Clostridium oceanicum]|uniref:histidine kinase n=1 Tax=Clostridium oceanicum TaxID=1543 RepID=A0ABP3UNN0_9CLOT